MKDERGNNDIPNGSRLRLYAVVDLEGLERFRAVVLQALGEIGARSGGRYPPERVFERLKEELPNRRGFAMWVAVDGEKLAAGRPVNDAVCGLMTLNLVEDEVGTPVAFMSRGWIRRGYEGGPLDLVLPHVDAWAKARAAKTVLLMTERGTKQRRMRGLLAYARWIGRRGFRMRETIFERVVT